MSWAYPAAFAVMAAEGAGVGPPPPASVAAAGWALFVASKALKYWAIAALGPRWTFRVLVLPAEPLVSSGPYAWLRHPNYLAVAGELVSMALVAGAPVTGPAATLLFSLLLRRRIQVEDEALRHLPCSSPVGTGGDA
jgi:methyltransferase